MTEQLTASEIVRSELRASDTLVERTGADFEYAALTRGDRMIAVGTEYDEDGETIWGWTWTLYAIDGDIEEEVTTDASQDADEVRAAIVAWLDRA